jgi:hypothetical protein
MCNGSAAGGTVPACGQTSTFGGDIDRGTRFGTRILFRSSFGACPSTPLEMLVCRSPAPNLNASASSTTACACTPLSVRHTRRRTRRPRRRHARRPPRRPAGDGSAAVGVARADQARRAYHRQHRTHRPRPGPLRPGADGDQVVAGAICRTMVDSPRYPMTMTDSAGTIDPALRP